METHVNTYKGLNKDISYDSLPAHFYIDALDVRISTATGESTEAVTNIKGNEFSFSLNTESTGVTAIIGYATIRNKIILFVADDSNTNGWLYEVIYNPSTRILENLNLLYFNIELGFSKNNPIEALGRYESSSIQRVYWTDYNNFFRSINVADPNINTLPIELIDIYPDVEFVQPLLTTVSSGGNIQTGLYQFAYRLITNDGKQTLICPPSNMIHIVSDSELNSQSASYNGNPTPIDSGKSITITVDTSQYSNYKSVEFISIYHSSSTAIPEVKVVEQVGINNQATTTLIYTSNEGTSYPIELLEFTIRNYVFKTCKSLTQKDNSLVIANLISSKISIQDLLADGETFDARTPRYNNNGFTYYPNDTEEHKLANAFNEVLNKDAHWDSDWHTNGQYKYQDNGTRLGGTGPNISYNFHLEPFTVDGDTQAGFANVAPIPNGFSYDSHDLNDGYGTRINTTYPNNASPYISGLLRGYKRGETYRFGIVFYTNKGEATFVEYIGDIKFPDISEEDSVANSSGTYYFPLCRENSDDPQYTIAYNLGIQFNIDFSSCPSLLDKVTSYQIVRVKRTDNDKRRLSQGIVKMGEIYPIGPGSSDFDLGIAGKDVVHLNDVDNYNVIQNLGTNPNNGYNINRYLGVYTPEISFNYSNVINNTLATNTGILITGAYSLVNNILNFDFEDKRSVDLPEFTQDTRLKIKNTYQVSFNSIENIKAWDKNAYFNMIDTSTYGDKIVDWGTIAMRNYYAYNNGTDLNDPDHSNPTSSSFSRSGSNIIGFTKSYINDPITQQPVPTIPSTEYFKNYTLGGVELLNSSDPAYLLIDLVCPKAEVYSGYTTNALESNTFIACSPIIDVSNTNPIVFGGDIFLNMFTLQTKMVEFDTSLFKTGVLKPYFSGTTSSTELYVVESSINIDLSYGASLRTNVKYTFSNDEATIYRQETNNTIAPQSKSLSMYAYNNVYSRESSDVTFFVKPSTAQTSDTNDLRAYLSNVKINGETIDSWTKFGANNFYDIDDYGPINKILNWRDSVFFIQDKAVGIYAINRAAITTTADGVPTQLGTGLGFGKHQYLSKEHGSIHQWGIKATESGVYIFDALHRKIFIASGEGNIAISEAKGIHSLLQQLPSDVFVRKENGGDNPIIGKGVHIGKDLINDEIIFTFLSKNHIHDLVINNTYNIGNLVVYNNTYYYVTAGFTTGTNMIVNVGRLLAHSRLATQSEIFNGLSIVFDEAIGQFSTRFSQLPSIWIDNNDILLSPNPLNTEDVYTHNIGNWGTFYGKQEECSIQLVINPQADINKILRTIEYNSIVRDNNKTIDRESTITAFRIQTQYQDTTKIPFSADRIKRRFDKWRIKIPRDTLSINQQARLRSTYFIVTLYFDNTSNKEIILNRLLSHFDYQMF